MISFINNTFYLNTKKSSYIMSILPDGVLRHCYYGKKIPIENMDFYNLNISFDYMPTYKINDMITALDALPQDCSSRGRGDFRVPAVVINNCDGRRINEYRYISHNISDGAPILEGLPHLNIDIDSAQTLEIIMLDKITNVKLHLFYVVFEDIDIIARHTVVENTTDSAITINSVASASFDFERCDFDMISLYGRWANERMVERCPLRHGKTEISSERGASGHALNPFAALAENNASEDYGEVYGLSLIYSGNFEIGAEVGQFGTTRFYAGINSNNFSWQLSSGESFTTPQAVMTYSSNGFGTMSRNFHNMCRKHLGACAKATKHPVVFNLWEAFYFDVNEEKVLATIESVKECGIDTIVLDDGWFGKRNSENTSMGDWFINKNKFPNGLDRIISLCEEYNLKFGLWFEPEMIGLVSEIYKNHPDWCIHIPGIEGVLSRGEFVLDLSRDDVVESVYNSVSSILNKYDISYVKWDMNRYMTDFGSSTLPAHRQGEHVHRYMLGVYNLMERLTKNFPHIFFEGSAGGGGRFDFGILYYMPQIWASDNSDALGRLKIQHGTSFVYPPETIASHISACPNHQTGRNTPLKSRGDVAQLFSMGYELDPGILSQEELNELTEQIRYHKKLNEWITESDFYRLIDPSNSDDCSWQVVSKDKKYSEVFYMVQLTTAKRLGKYLKIKGLDANKKYNVKPLDLTLAGSTLMNAGIPIKEQMNDFETILFKIEMI